METYLQLFPRKPSQEAGNAGPEERRATVAQIVQRRQTLDSHLDHMVKFLELDRKHLLPDQFRAGFLEEVRTTMDWKQQSLTAEKLECKIEELSAFMEQSLKKCGLMQ